MEELAYIAAYFEGGLSEKDRTAFEERCLNDALFAQEVASYVMMRDALQQQLHDRKRADFNKLFAELKAEADAGMDKKEKGRPYYLFKNLPWYAAAASIALLATWLILFRPASPQNMAKEYAAAHFSTLGATMGEGATEVLQKGIAAFNDKRYGEATAIFEKLQTDSLLKPDAVKYLGITQLKMGNYKAAIASFDILSKMDLHTNPGLFYKAVTLLERSAIGDMEIAKECLEEVVSKNLAGKKEAENWLQKM